ncbi:MAG: hypothetical protein ABI597_06070 [Gammaproteobacteria bacterium]
MLFDPEGKFVAAPGGAYIVFSPKELPLYHTNKEFAEAYKNLYKAQQLVDIARTNATLLNSKIEAELKVQSPDSNSTLLNKDITPERLPKLAKSISSAQKEQQAAYIA